jgi:7-carboxy-7-deazaguanine synthase
MLKRIEDYNKVLPVLEVYRTDVCKVRVPVLDALLLQLEQQDVLTVVGLVKEGGATAWYTSIHPEKGTFTFNDIVAIYDENPQVKEMMLTGGSPTMHPALVNELTHFANERGILITIETEGSHFVETDYPLGLVSLSPKFSNSRPRVGITTPAGKVVDEKFVAQHEKFRLTL